MKTKVTIVLALLALGTLSFTFTNVEVTKSTKESYKIQSNHSNEPSGGFLLEDKM